MDTCFHIRQMAKYDDFNFSVSRMTLNADYAPHQHDFNELEIILSGNAINSVNGFEFPVGAGDLFVIGREARHEIRQVDALELYNIAYDASALRSCNEDLRGLPGFHTLFALDALYAGRSGIRMKLNPAAFARVKTLLEELHAEYTNGEAGFRSMIMCDFTRLLLILSRSCSAGESSGSIGKIAHACAYIEREYLSDVNIGRLAASVFMSERHFRRLFGRIYGMSPFAYILSLRLAYACQLLRTTSQSITEIAMASGFSDDNYFTRCFRQKIGTTPGRYRASGENRP